MFKHADQALRFAFRMREKSLISKASYDSGQKEGNPSVHLSAHDFHAQAGMVFSFIERQPLHEQCYIYLTYGSPQERDAAAGILAADLSVPKHLKNRTQLKSALLSKTVRQCAKDNGLSVYKAWRTKQTIQGMLEPIALRVNEKIEGWFDIQAYA